MLVAGNTDLDLEQVAVKRTQSPPIRSRFNATPTATAQSAGRAPSPPIRGKKPTSPAPPSKRAPAVSVSPMVLLKRTKKQPRLSLPVPFALTRRRDANELLKMIENQVGTSPLYVFLLQNV